MEDKELRNRIQQADANKDFASLNETVVAAGPLGGPAKVRDYRTLRLSLAGVAASVLAVGLALPQALAPRPLFEVASGGNPQATGLRAGAPEAADAAMTTDMKMIWPGWIEYNYIAEGLSDQAGSGEIFEVRRVGDPVTLINQVASAFGVAGEVKEDEWSTAEYPSYSMTGEDFSVNVWWSGPGGWSFGRWSNDWMGCVEPGFEGEEGSSDDSTARDSSISACEPQVWEPTPELIPSEAEMLLQATKIFESLGVNVDASNARIYRDEWGGSVSFPLTLNGTPIPLETYIGWDGKGQLSYASGYSVEIVSRGMFDTISPLAAVDRISDWRWFGGAASIYYERLYADMPVLRADTSVSSDAESAETDSDIAIDEPAVIPAPEEQPNEPEIVDVRITESESALLSLWDSNGNMWLVPGYLLYNDQGWFDSIVAVEEGVISLPEPIEVMPIPYDDAPAVEPQVEPKG